MARLLSYTLVLIGFMAACVSAELPPMPDANDAIFTATQVVIVAPGKPHTFTVERSYAGNLPIGSAIDLPAFELVTWGKWGEKQIQPLTDATRILMFLEPDAKNPAALVITYYGHAFFFRDLAKIDELDALAGQAIAFHKKWQEARDIFDPHDRIVALFPYLLHSPASCSRLTLKELAKLNPDSGDYLASMLPNVSANDRQSLLLNIRQLQSPKAHAAAVAAVDLARRQFSNYLDAHHLKSLDVKAHWSEIPDELKEVNGTIYYGLAAIRAFGDKTDTAYFRSLVPFLLANDFDQPIEECVYAMEHSPAAENIPVLNTIWEDYKSRRYPPENEPLLPIYLANALGTQNDAAAIPTLLELLDNRHAHDSALGALRHVSKQDFRTDAEWKSWYAGRSKPARDPQRGDPESRSK